VTDAMPHLVGKKVAQFMPKMMTCVGKEPVTFEMQEKGKATRRQAPLALYIQELQQSSREKSYLMTSHSVLERQELAEFVMPPQCLGGDQTNTIPECMRPSHGPVLIVGGRGATCALHRDPVVWLGWNVLVLGRKQWHLFPPSATAKDLHAQVGVWGSGFSQDDTFSPEGQSCFSPWPPVDLWEGTQEMGELLLVPPGWWHQTLHEDRTLAIMGQSIPESMLPAIAEELTKSLSGQPRKDIGKQAHQSPRSRLSSLAQEAVVDQRPDRRRTLWSAARS